MSRIHSAVTNIVWLYAGTVITVCAICGTVHRRANAFRLDADPYLLRFPPANARLLKRTSCLHAHNGTAHSLHAKPVRVSAGALNARIFAGRWALTVGAFGGKRWTRGDSNSDVVIGADLDARSDDK